MLLYDSLLFCHYYLLNEFLLNFCFQYFRSYNNAFVVVLVLRIHCHHSDLSKMKNY